MVAVEPLMDVQRVDGAVVIRFCDIQIDVSNCAAVFGEIERLVRVERPLLLIVNMRRVTYLHSVAIGRLLELQRAVESYGGAMQLCSLASQAHETLSITRVDRLLKIVDVEPVTLSPSLA